MVTNKSDNVKTLTPGQKVYLEFIFKFIESKGYSPSLRNIAEHFNKSLSTAQHFVGELEQKGYLRKTKYKSRAILPVDESSASIMKLGFIKAGSPVEPIETPESIFVPKSMVAGSGQYYALEVKGDSMIDDGLWDKDIIVVKHQFNAEENETVVAITEDGATLKKLKYKDGKPYLQPRNPKYSPIFPKGKLEIRGKLVGIIHKES